LEEDGRTNLEGGRKRMSQIEPLPEKKPRWSGLSHIQINKKEAISGFRWSLFYNVINKLILPLLNNAVVLRVLGPSIGGLYSLCYAFFAASDTFRDFGLSQTYMRDQEITPKREASYMMLGILQGLIPGGLLFAFRHQIADYYQNAEIENLMVWVSLGLVINGFWTIPKAKVLKAGRIRESGARETIANVLAVALSIWMLFNGYENALCLVFPLFVNCVLNVLITYGLAPVTNFRSDVATMWKTLRSAASTMGASALYNIYIQSDKFVIGRLAGQEAVGLYGQGQGLAMKPMQLLSMPMMAPLQSAFSQNSKNHEKIGNIYVRALTAALLFIVPLYAIMVVAAGPITTLILGHKWSGSIPLVQICCVFFAARTIGTIGGTALVAGGKARFAVTSWAFCYATAIVGCIIAAQVQGTTEQKTMAFAWAFSIGAVVVYTVHTLFAFRWFPPDQGAREKLRSATLVAVMTCLLFAGIYLLPLGSWVALAIACVVGPLFHLAVVGWVLEKKPQAYMSVSGVKRLYHAL
jgi:O-antigen/teichoic acid export membrane protein